MAEPAREYNLVPFKKNITQCNTYVATEYTFFFLNCKEKRLFYEWRFMCFSNKKRLPEDNKTHDFLLFHTTVLLI